MITTEPITFRHIAVPVGFETDYCTFAPDRFFGYDLTEACVAHDYMRRILVVRGELTVQGADWLFRAHLRELAPRWVATLYWLGVKANRLWRAIRWAY